MIYRCDPKNSGNLESASRSLAAGYRNFFGENPTEDQYSISNKVSVNVREE